VKIISLFNNKGGVGKSTLAFHLGCSLAENGKRVLFIDLDPQCNLTIFGMKDDALQEIWSKEDQFIEDFAETREKVSPETFNKLLTSTRTIHFLLKPSEEGTSEISSLPPPTKIENGLDLIPGRLTLHRFENRVAERWNGLYQGDPLSIRTITAVRTVAENYAKQYSYDYVIVDTSPSLGILNRVIISNADGFIIPALPDMFSLYGIRNIGTALSQWKKEFETIYSLISEDKRKRFPKAFVRFLGYTIYNAKKFTGVTAWDLSKAHYNFAIQIPETVMEYIKSEVRESIPTDKIRSPIGSTNVMHTHNTLPAMAQKYNVPIWKVPSFSGLDLSDRGTIQGNRAIYEATKDAYKNFTDSLLERISYLK
jgi:cellulose biosynthesis protein BcsQ